MAQVVLEISGGVFFLLIVFILIGSAAFLDYLYIKVIKLPDLLNRLGRDK